MLRNSFLLASIYSVALLLRSYALLVSRRVRVNPSLRMMSSKIIDDDGEHVVVIGSGIAGLSCAAILAATGKKVTVFESHYEVGGCAHEFLYTSDGKSIPSDRIGKDSADKEFFHFEAGPSLYSGLSSTVSPNPLKHVFQMIDEEPEWIKYELWGAYLPEGSFKLSIGAEPFEEVLQRYGSPTAVSDWRKLALALRPLADGVMGLPSGNILYYYSTVYSKTHHCVSYVYSCLSRREI